jgi:hypothetical protein
MRRLARHAFTALAALSLLLCVAACMLWARSCRLADQWYFATAWRCAGDETSKKVCAITQRKRS